MTREEMFYALKVAGDKVAGALQNPVDASEAQVMLAEAYAEYDALMRSVSEQLKRESYTGA